MFVSWIHGSQYNFSIRNTKMVTSLDWIELIEAHFLSWSLTACGKGRVASPKRMNFWKSSKGGRGEGRVRTKPKIYVADFGPLNRAF